MTRVDYRGRPVWEKTYAVDRLSRAIKLQQTENGYILAANAAGSVWLGFFDEQGVLTGNKIIAEPSMRIEATDMVMAIDGSGYILTITKVIETGTGKNKAIRKEGSVYKIDTKGAVAWKRSFSMGGDGELLGLSAVKFSDDQSGYIATGYLENEAGKKLGLVLRLDSSGALIWQQEYARGLQSQFTVSSVYHEKYILAFGDVRPGDAGTLGSWLALVDAADGKLHWQRYYSGETGAHDYRARGVSVNRDGLITLMMQAQMPEGYKPPKPKDESDKTKSDSTMVGDITIPEMMNYAHVLTLSPRGVTLSGDSYFQGKGVTASQMIEGPKGERMIAGSTIAQSSAAEVPRDFKPDWEADFAYGPEPQSIPQEAPKPTLPEAPMSDTTKSGLALLTQKLRQQTEATQKDVKNQTDSDNSSKNVQQNSESDSSLKDTFSENGWIVVGAAPEPYADPCRAPVIDIPKD